MRIFACARLNIGGRRGFSERHQPVRVLPRGLLTRSFVAVLHRLETGHGS